MKFLDIVCAKAIVPDLKAKDRDGAITELIAAFAKAGRLKAAQSAEITKSVIKREREASTGMGKGVAVPHVKHAAVKEAIAAIGRSSRGIDFSSLDKQPVYSVILLISPVDNPDNHLRAMECIFKHLQHEKFRKFLRQSQTVEQIEELIKEVDENPSFY